MVANYLFPAELRSWSSSSQWSPSERLALNFFDSDHLLRVKAMKLAWWRETSFYRMWLDEWKGSPLNCCWKRALPRARRRRWARRREPSASSKVTSLNLLSEMMRVRTSWRIRSFQFTSSIFAQALSSYIEVITDKYICLVVSCPGKWLVSPSCIILTTSSSILWLFSLQSMV